MPLVRLVALCAVVLAFACKPADKPAEVLAEAPEELVAAHTAGLVSRASAVTVRFTSEVVEEAAVGASPATSPFTFSPAIEGAATWTSRQQIEYRPAKELPPGEVYDVVFDAGKVVPGKPAFRFQFAVARPDFRPIAIGLEAADAEGVAQRYRGALDLADVADAAAVEKMLTARHGEDPLTVTWEHDGLAHRYTVEGIRRVERGSTLTLSFDGSPIGAEKAEVVPVQVPGLNQFVVSTVRAQIEGDRLIEIRFSDPLAAKQDLRGLVRVAGREDLRFDVDGSVVRVYTSGVWSPTEEVQIAGVKNARGYKLLEPRTEVVSFEPLKPQVRFVGDSVILPTSANLTVPLEVVNVTSVEVEATRVYESNVPQFLQVNDLGGDDELRRVGTVVWKEKVKIDAADAHNRWVRVGLDLSALVKDHPTGLYRLKVSFGRRDIAWDCVGEPWEERAAAPEQPWDATSSESSFWDSWTVEDGWYWDWDRRDDPCDRSYYVDYSWAQNGRVASRNVIVTDVGLTARQGAGGSVGVVATDLRTGAPLSGADVTLLDFQLQPLARASTNTDGFADLAGKDEHPFAVVGRANGQVSWLRLDRGEALSVAHFDVGGAQVSDGLKGYLYGERGVWRPGDPMFLTFVLHDAKGEVPASHPIEFQLRNPRGQTVETRTIASGVDGFYAIRTSTPGDAPTGKYTALVRAGGAVFQKQLRVETVMPNRLKIELPVPKGGLRAPDLKLSSTLSSRWLHGAIAQGMDADVELSLRPKATTFARYEEFTFDDPSVAFHSEPEQIWQGTLDDEGKATVAASFEAPPSPGMLTGTLRTRVYEPSGAASVDEVSVDVSPYERYVGLALPKGDKARGMLLTDTPHKVRVVAVNADGKPTGDGVVRMSVRKLQWRYWWEQGEEDPASYAGVESRHELASGEVNLKGGEATWEFQIRYPEWGRYLVTAHDVESGHTSGKVVYVDWPGWAGRASKDQPGGASVLSLTTDKDKVEVGQPVTLSFPLPAGARALVSLEDGARVVKSWWATPSGADTAQVTFTAEAGMAPTIYAHVTVIQPHQTLANDAPMRLYGIVPIAVYDPATKLEPQIATDGEWRPERTAHVSIREAKGRAMTYTLAVVDEGLLGLTRHQTPNPWDTFYAREALGVRTWDLFDRVANSYGGTLEQLLAIGGDGEAELNKRPKAQRFKPVVYFEGPLTLAAGATDERDIPLPAYVGEVRVMVVAGKGAAFGSAEKSVPVRAPLMALATLPRVLGPGEEVELPVSVWVMDPKLKDATVKVETSGPVALADGKPKTLKFSQPGEKMASFRLRVGDTLGVAKVTVTTTGGGEKTTQTIEIDVRHPGAPATHAVAATVKGGKSWSEQVAFVGMAGSNDVTLEVSRMPPLQLGSRLPELLQYPHGCLEQTLSAAFPQVALHKVIDLSPAEAEAASKHVRAAISKLAGFQSGDGGFGYWPGESGDPWSTSYAGHFLVEAERNGYVVPGAMKSAWLKAQRARADRWSNVGDRSDLDQAYRLYTMALAGSPDVGAMNRLSESTLSPTARWRLAAAWQLAGQAATAKQVVGKTDTTVSETRELGGTFGSPLRDRALLLEALVLLGDPRAPQLATLVSDGLTRDGFLSTQETAQALVALSRFGVDRADAAETAFEWSFDGGKATAVKSAKPIAQVKVPVGKATAGKFALTSQSAGTLFVRVIARGLPPVGGEYADVSEGLDLDVTYESPSGVELGARSLEQGTSLVAHVVVRNTTGRKLQELALSQVFPSGWEIAGASPGKGEGYQYRDVRDDRVYTYFDLAPGASLDVRIPVNASYLGRFWLPPVTVEAMYDTTISAREGGEWVEVTSQLVD
ncbi:MAG: alpha-2-macroglobulin family protein [Myxococcota bacterium]